MTYLIVLLSLAKTGGMSLKVKDLLFASESRLKVIVGPRTSPKREPGIRFDHPGYHEVWVDGDGAGMHHLRLGLGQLLPCKAYLKEIGLDGTKATMSKLPVAASSIPLFRNKLSLSGVKGIPASAKHKPWSVTYVEYAMANKIRLRSTKPQIQAQPVGEGRNRLIRSCYDWWSELDFTNP